MPFQELARQSYRLRITNPDDKSQYVDIPVIHQITFRDMRKYAQEYMWQFNNGPNSSRAGHSQTVNYNSGDGNSDASQKLVVERTENAKTRDKRSYAQDNYNGFVNWDPPPSTGAGKTGEIAHRVTHVVRYTFDNTPDGVPWIDVELIDQVSFRDRRSYAQESIIRLKNNPGEDTISDITDDTYKPKFAQCDTSLALVDPTSLDNTGGINPPWRTDPFQNIVNVKWTTGTFAFSYDTYFIILLKSDGTVIWDLPSPLVNKFIWGVVVDSKNNVIIVTSSGSPWLITKLKKDDGGALTIVWSNGINPLNISPQQAFISIDAFDNVTVAFYASDFNDTNSYVRTYNTDGAVIYSADKVPTGVPFGGSPVDCETYGVASAPGKIIDGVKTIGDRCTVGFDSRQIGTGFFYGIPSGWILLENTGGANSSAAGLGVCSDRDGNFIAVMQRDIVFDVSSTASIWKVSPQGSVIWKYSLNPGGALPRAFDCDADLQGNVYFVEGNLASPGFGIWNNLAVVKISPSGSLLWKFPLSAPDVTFPSGAVLAASDGVIFNTDNQIWKVAADGSKVLWTKAKQAFAGGRRQYSAISVST